MYKVCKTEQSASRQRELEQGLLQMMTKRQYEDITVSDLCSFMQIPRKSFYRYFSSKDGALFALLDHSLMEFYDMPDPEQKSGTAIGDLDRFFQFWYEHRTLLSALQRSSLGGLLVERSTYLAIRERLMPERMKNWDESLQAIAMAFSICGLLSMVMQWHQQGFQHSSAEMAKLATEMLTQPLIPRQ